MTVAVDIQVGYLYYQHALTTTVNGSRIESRRCGSGVVKVYFRPVSALPQRRRRTVASQTVIKQLPAGTTPPNILVFDASRSVLDLRSRPTT
jgi:hypothetical protein